MACPPYSGCAASTKTELESIVGTAPCEEAYFILEQAKPWPAKIKKMEGLVETVRRVLKEHQAEDIKLIATPSLTWLPPASKPRGLLLRRRGGKTRAKVIEANSATIRQSLQEDEGEGEHLELYLVCTHGTRDPCCGALGIPIFRTLCEKSERKIIQVSHLGGHRFAPVLAIMPEWKFFGHLTVENCLQLDDSLRGGKPHVANYRGSGLLAPHLQIIEAALWEQKRVSPIELRQVQGDKRNVRVVAVFPDGSSNSYQCKIGEREYQGYKSCKDYRKGKESNLKLPVLKTLVEV